MFSGIEMTTASAARIWESLSVFSGNLSGQSVPGYRADSVYPRQSEATQTAGGGEKVPSFALTSASNFTSGLVKPTGRQLDVAVDGPGWLVVRDASGGEGLTRNGLLSLNAEGEVMAAGGTHVMSEAGPLVLPAYTQLTIGSDGVVSVVPAGSWEVETVGRLRLANPPTEDLVRGSDGLFRLADGSAPTQDPDVQLVSGALEESNVDLIAEYLNVIDTGKTMELHVRMLSAFDKMADRGNGLLRLTPG